MLLTPADERLSWLAPQPVDTTRAEVRLERFPHACQQLLAGQIGPLANLRSSTGCGVQFATDAAWIELRLDRLRHHQPFPQGVALEVRQSDGGWLAVESPDLRERDGAVAVRLPTGLVPGELRTCIIWLPPISTCAVAGIMLPDGCQIVREPAPVPRWLALGDSLTQGFSTQSPLTTWVHRLMRRWDAPAWNLGVGGLLIEPAVFTWALESRRWPLITIALGSNHCWREATVANAAEACSTLIEAALAASERVVWCLPPWKPMEDGKGPPEFMGIPLDRDTGARVGRIRTALRERLAAYPGVTVVEDLLPHDHRQFPDGLHPAALGFAKYGEKMGRIVPPPTP